MACVKEPPEQFRYEPHHRETCSGLGRNQGRDIASRIGLPLTTGKVEGYRFVLEVALDQLAIRDLYQFRTRPVSIGPLRPRAPGRGRDLLARATGRNCRTVFDATAGLGREPYIWPGWGVR
ncbi:MAG: hypothetical protein CM1200mP20_02520 [Pseudomonadota bacterium]|nr:MAG: hypothetical protein CM1200mP20_02520 [Pseudomonadota bacterium]